MGKINTPIYLDSFYLCLFLHSPKKGRLELVAQLVEQYTFNVWALGSSPSGITKLRRKSGLFLCKAAKQACLIEWMSIKKAKATHRVAFRSFEQGRHLGRSA